MGRNFVRQRQLSVLLLFLRSCETDGPWTQWTKERRGGKTVAGKSMIHILGRKRVGRKEGNGGKWRSAGKGGRRSIPKVGSSCRQRPESRERARDVLFKGGHSNLCFHILSSKVGSDTPNLVHLTQLLIAKYSNLI